MAVSDDSTDESLMGRIQNGDHQAFSCLVRRHSELFYACAYRVCGNREEAEDAVQDAFLKLWKNPMIWRDDKGAKFTTWFYRIVINAATDRFRRNKKYVAADYLENEPSDKDGADEVMHKNIEEKALELAIQSLPERQKLALNLCFYEGLSNKEAADILGIGLKALESLIMRAKASIRDTLNAQGLIEKEKKYG
jgi:RNA polymerase sigma-70 factor (ECF subfamily)